jgi:hypothetical protein
MAEKRIQSYLSEILGIIVLVFGIVFVSCSQSIGEAADMALHGEVYSATTEPGKTYQNLLSLTVNAVTKSVEKVAEYDENVAAQFNDRSLTDQVFDLGDIYALADFGKAKNGQARSVDGADSMMLGEELTEIATEYEKAVSAMAPADLSFLDGVDGVIIEDGLVYIDDDIIIDPTTTSGIMQLNLIQAQLTGEDFNVIITDINDVADSFGEADDSAVARGIYKTSTSRWPSKTVSYAWGNISANSKVLFQNAMADWSSKISGLTFVDRTNDTGYMSLATLGIKPLVVLKSDPNLSAFGSANIGTLYGKSFCTVRDGLTGNWAIRTPRHELGHTLGLQHEHQRWDRDTYLSFNSSITSDTTNWGKIDKAVTNAIYGWYIDYFTVKILFVKVRVYYPAYGKIGTITTTIADGTATLDYRSIMLYSAAQVPSLKAKVAQQGLSVGSAIPVNYEISSGDITTVKKMYP